MSTPIPDVARELFTKCEQKIQWIKKEGLDLNNLQAAAEFAADLAMDAKELADVLKDELMRQRKASA